MKGLFVTLIGWTSAGAWGVTCHDMHLPASLFIAGTGLIVLAQLGAYEVSA